MKEYNKRFDFTIFSIAAIATPILCIIHELVHICLFQLGGIKAQLVGVIVAQPVHFEYNFDGLKEAVQFYNSSDTVVVIAAIAAAMFTLAVAYLSLLLYCKRPSKFLWAFAVGPIILRYSGITAMMPEYIKGRITGSDEAIAAYFLHVPLMTFYIPSLLLGYVAVLLLTIKLEKKNRWKYFISATIGSVGGTFILVVLTNLLLFKNPNPLFGF